MQIDDILKVKDLWSFLSKAQETKPIVLYGMGDGADKIINVCNEKSIKISGVFASDGFASGKLFRGFNVISYSEMCEKFDDFIVLLSFATQRDEVLENIIKISKEKELYCPDVPVFGDGLFDSEFVNNNFDKISQVYNMLCDDTSKRTYISTILAKLTGNIKYLFDCQTDVSESYLNIIKPNENFHYVDIGAYNGDTIREFLLYSGGKASKITAFEPDFKNFSKLINFAHQNDIDTSEFYNCAAWDKCESIQFYSRSGRNSAGTTSCRNAKISEILAKSADSMIDSKVHYVKIDAEGSDAKAIMGLKNTLISYRPCVNCAIYHRNEDIFEIPLLLSRIYGQNFKMYIRHFKYLPAWDTNVYIKSCD